MPTFSPQNWGAGGAECKAFRPFQDLCVHGSLTQKERIFLLAWVLGLMGNAIDLCLEINFRHNCPPKGQNRE